MQCHNNFGPDLLLWNIFIIMMEIRFFFYKCIHSWNYIYSFNLYAFESRILISNMFDWRIPSLPHLLIPPLMDTLQRPSAGLHGQGGGSHGKLPRCPQESTMAGTGSLGPRRGSTDARQGGWGHQGEAMKIMCVCLCVCVCVFVPRNEMISEVTR